MGLQSISAECPRLLVSEIRALNGKGAFARARSTAADFSQRGLDYQTIVYALAAIISQEDMGSCTFVIPTNDLTNCTRLDAMPASIAWKV